MIHLACISNDASFELDEKLSTTINLDAFVADIDALRQMLGYDRIDVLGHSFGALIALEYAPPA